MAFQESLRGREVNEVRSISEERAPVFNRLIDENNRRFKEEILPLYREMVNKFAGNLGLAYDETRTHLGSLVEYVEIWERRLNGTLPAETVEKLDHTESHHVRFKEEERDERREC